jgi:hypothetical protein
MPRDRLELQDRLMDRENGVGFVYDNRVDMRNRALEITTPPMLDGGGSAAYEPAGFKMAMGLKTSALLLRRPTRCLSRCRLRAKSTIAC